jgi:hypothetical protein
MTTTIWLLAALAAPAHAQAIDDGPLSDDETAPEPIELKVVPPRVSWDVGVTAGYVGLPQFENVPPWLGFGLRVAGGKLIGRHRVGGGLGFMFEGPVGLSWANTFEPQFMWDWQSDKGVLFGAYTGATLAVNAELVDGKSGLQTSLTPGPMAGVRVGWSQPHNLLMRRMFVAVEPRFRYLNGEPTFAIYLTVGSGAGR